VDGRLITMENQDKEYIKLLIRRMYNNLNELKSLNNQLKNQDIIKNDIQRGIRYIEDSLNKIKVR